MDALLSSWTQRFRSASWGRFCRPLEELIERERDFFRGRGEEWLDAHIQTLRGQLSREAQPNLELMARALAMVSEISMRVIGRQPSNDDMLVAGGMLAGKVVAHGPDCDRGLSLCLAGAVAALGGAGVHVVSPREPRAASLYERFKAVFDRLGVSSSALVQKSSVEERRSTWRSEVVFAGVAALMDEFLKDKRSGHSEGGRASRLVSRITGGEEAVSDLRMRGLQLALLDDASGLLCDFATRPFIVRDKEATEEEQRARELACRLAAELKEGVDFRLNGPELLAELTPEGEARLDTIQGVVSGPLARPLSRRRLIEDAVVAQHLLQRDRHYGVEEGRIAFQLEGDLITGTEAAPDAKLLALLEVKEGLPPSQQAKVGVHGTLGRVLRRYLALGGSTPSAAGLVGEISREFETPVVRMEKGRTAAQEDYVSLLSLEERKAWILDELSELSASGDGAWVLCATEASSAEVREWGAELGVEFSDWDVATADPRGLHLVTAQLGGETPFPAEGSVVGPPLVLILDCLDALHLERQLLDRLQPVKVKRGFSFDDELLGKLMNERVITSLRWVCAQAPITGRLIAKACLRFIYSRAEAARRRARRAYEKAEEEEHRQLAFTGPPST